MLEQSGRFTGSMFGPVGRRWTALVTAGSLLVSGCYTTVPLQSSTKPNATVVLTVNDRGRVALENRMGPEVGSVEGRLVTRTDSLYTLHVTAVSYLSGNVSKWSGEEESIRTEWFRDARQRTVSVSRSLLAAGIAAAAVGLFIGTREIFGIGGSEVETPRPPSTGQTLRAP